MNLINTAIVNAFMPPPQDTNLVVFADEKNYIAHYDTPKLLSSAIRYAKEYNVHVVTDCFVSEDYLCMCMIDPQGEAVIGQRGIYQNLSYRGLFRKSAELSVTDTPFGKVCLLVDVDINYPQILRAAQLKGAQLIIANAFIQVYDFYDERIDYIANNIACSYGVDVILSTNIGGCIIGKNGNVISPFSEILPVYGKFSINQTIHDSNNMKMSLKLIHNNMDTISQKFALSI